MKRQFAVHQGVRGLRGGPPMVTHPPRTEWKGPVLFYDQRCSVCRRFIAWVIDADHSGLLRIAPLQGRRFEVTQRTHPEFDAKSSAIWFPRHGPPQSQSDAILAGLYYLGGIWRFLARTARLVPRAWRNRAYLAFASRRGNFGWLGLRELDADARARALPGDGPRAVD